MLAALDVDQSCVQSRPANSPGTRNREHDDVERRSAPIHRGVCAGEQRNPFFAQVPGDTFDREYPCRALCRSSRSASAPLGRFQRAVEFLSERHPSQRGASSCRLRLRVELDSRNPPWLSGGLHVRLPLDATRRRTSTRQRRGPNHHRRYTNADRRSPQRTPIVVKSLKRGCLHPPESNG